MLSALAEGSTTLIDLLDANDTRVMRSALSSLGVVLRPTDDALIVDGCGGRWPTRRGDLLLGNAGTAFRSLTAALAFSGGQYRLDGVARMRERPIGDLVDSLNALGARIRYEGAAGYPPLAIDEATAVATDEVEIGGAVSSQFLSGLLMAAPLIAPASGLRIRVAGELISQPYVAMNLALMERFGVKVAREGAVYCVPRARYRSPARVIVEGDASSASYFLALGAIAGGPVRVEGIGRHSVQGDIRFADALAAMGAHVEVGENHVEASAAGRLHGLDFDATAIPDAAMTLAIVALFADGPTTLRGIGSWRVKETDRITAMATEMRKLGAVVDEGRDWLRMNPPDRWLEAEVDTYDDHRIAMCFSLAAAGGVPVHVRDPRCVAKTFPNYFDQLATLVKPVTEVSKGDSFSFEPRTT